MRDAVLCWIVFWTIDQATANMNFSLDAIWNQTGVTVAGGVSNANGSSLAQLADPFAISITNNDILYISDPDNHHIVVVDLVSKTNISIIGSGPGSNLNQFDAPFDLFLTNTSLYVIELNNARLKKMDLNGANPSLILNTNKFLGSVYFYIDNDENMYVSSVYNNTVVLCRLNTSNFAMVAGTGIAGANNNQLNTPYGVFVNENRTIYVADCGNNRVMKWYRGAPVGIRVAGDGTSGIRSTQLSCPTQIIVDIDETMYISERDNSRITRWKANASVGVCIAGCMGTSGRAATQLDQPYSFTFDRYGSLYVCDRENHRVQKFQYLGLYKTPYNQPKLCPSATWNANATTFADANTIGRDSYDMFIDINNTIYILATNFQSVQIWSETSTNPIKNISTTLGYSCSIFITSNGDIYVDDGAWYGQVRKWIPDTMNSMTAMSVNESCSGLFVDWNENLYCSLGNLHQVVKISLYDTTNQLNTVAGNGIAGSQSHMLRIPRGILVDSNLNLYIADGNNNRIQLFKPGYLNGTTVAGTGAPGTIALHGPVGIVFDADGYLFISDYYNHRIVGSDVHGFRCIVGCTNTNGSALDQLTYPWSLRFDSFGNLFVVDRGNSRIQKFLLQTNPCEETTTSEDSTTGVSTSTNDQNNTQVSSTLIDFHWNISADSCSSLQPCRNNGTCLNDNITSWNYRCFCPDYFNGSQCQFDHRPCQANTCRNAGLCSAISNTTFTCSCQTGWTDLHCQTKINYCTDLTCLNKGVCRPMFRNYTCLCLRDSYYGEHCEMTENHIIIRQTISRSFAFIVIIVMISAAIFIIILDLLKYCCGIDPIKKKVPSKKWKKKKKKARIIIQYIYVNAPSPN